MLLKNLLTNKIFFKVDIFLTISGGINKNFKKSLEEKKLTLEKLIVKLILVQKFFFELYSLRTKKYQQYNMLQI